jgi:phage terminase Nu1 subunit (DNA packaging protein)
MEKTKDDTHWAKKNYYTLTEARIMLGLSSPTMTKWAREGYFVGAERHGNGWMFKHNFKIKPIATRGRTRELLNRLLPDDYKEK